MAKKISKYTEVKKIKFYKMRNKNRKKNKPNYRSDRN